MWLNAYSRKEEYRVRREREESLCWPYRGSNLLGAYGFVDAVKELKEQLNEMNLEIDYIFFDSSSGGIQTGLKLGIDLFGLDTN